MVWVLQPRPEPPSFELVVLRPRADARTGRAFAGFRHSRLTAHAPRPPCPPATTSAGTVGPEDGPRECGRSLEVSEEEPLPFGGRLAPKAVSDCGQARPATERTCSLRATSLCPCSLGRSRVCLGHLPWGRGPAVSGGLWSFWGRGVQPSAARGPWTYALVSIRPCCCA